MKRTFLTVLITWTAIVGACNGVWYWVTNNVPPFWLSLSVLILGFIVGLLSAFWAEINHFRQILYLANHTSIEKEMEFLISHGKNIRYVGGLDRKISTLLAQKFEGRKSDEHVRITIYNTDPNFYQAFPPETARLVQHDAKAETFDLRFLFYPQMIDILAVTDESERTNLLLRWNAPDGEERGIRIRQTSWLNTSNQMPVTTFDDVDGSQGAYLAAASQLFRSYCEYVKDGWSIPILPSHDWDVLRKRMTDENLRWFSAVAKQLIHEATYAHKISITWHLHLGSSADSNTFSEWLLALQHNRARVERYLIIDTDLYHSSTDYQRIVDEIIAAHFDHQGNIPSARYGVWYIATKELRTLNVPDRDIGLFEVPRGIWAQDSLHESYNNGRRFLRVWFGRTSQLVEAHRHYFGILHQHQRKFENLQKLIAEYK